MFSVRVVYSLATYIKAERDFITVIVIVNKPRIPHFSRLYAIQTIHYSLLTAPLVKRN